MHLPHFHRRDLLVGAAALSPLVVAGRAFARGRRRAASCSSCSCAGPMTPRTLSRRRGSDFYHQARPTIALGKPDPADPKAPLPLDADWSLHTPR